MEKTSHKISQQNKTLHQNPTSKPYIKTLHSTSIPNEKMKATLYYNNNNRMPLIILLYLCHFRDAEIYIYKLDMYFLDKKFSIW